MLLLQQNFWPILYDCTQRILFFENKNLARLVLECLQYHSKLYPRLCIQDILDSGTLDCDAPMVVVAMVVVAMVVVAMVVVAMVVVAMVVVVTWAMTVFCFLVVVVLAAECSFRSS